MKGMFSAFTAYIIFRALENIAMIVGIIYASCYFNRFSLLWFLLIPAACQINFESRGESDNA